MRHLLLCSVFFIACGPQGSQWLKVDSLPTSSALNDIHGTSSFDVTVVGDDGLMLHFDGTAWTKVETATIADFQSVYAFDANTVYAVGETTALRGNATKGFQSLGVFDSYTRLKSVLPLSRNQVYVAGSSKARWHDGQTLRDLYEAGSSSSLKFYGGGDFLRGSAQLGAFMLQFDELYFLTEEFVNVLDVPSQSYWDILVVSRQGLFLYEEDDHRLVRFFGNGWSPVPIPSSVSRLEVGFTLPNDDALFLGNEGALLEWKEEGLTVIEPPSFGFSHPKFKAAFGTSAKDLWAVSRDGAIYRRYDAP